MTGPDTSIKQLLNTLPQTGRVEWIGLRPGRGKPMRVVETAELITDSGIAGDRYAGRPGSSRQVTLIQQEHLVVVGSVLDQPPIDACRLRRNIVVSGINLLALKDKTFQLGQTILEYTGLCHPCSKMETELGPGGYNAMRGHGGINARILVGGQVAVGDRLQAQSPG